jgi:hypothetical protein
MPELQDFLRSGSRVTRRSKVRAHISKALELLGKYEQMGASTFTLARTVSQPKKLELPKDALKRASAPRKLKLPKLRKTVLKKVEEQLRKNLEGSVEACTDLRYGEEVSKWVLMYSGVVAILLLVM